MGISTKEKVLNTNLIGKLVGKDCGFLDMSCILRRWRPRHGIRVTEMENNFYLFSFKSVEDFMKAWSKGAVFMGKQCLVIRRWHPKIELVDTEMTYAQLWIRLPGVHCQDYASLVVSAIASEFGGQIIAVEVSDGCEIHVCVEVDVNEPLVTEVMVGEGEKGVCQSLQYEIDTLCFNCGRIDHRKEECMNSDDRSGFGPHNMAPMKHAREPPFASLRYVSWRRPSPGWVKLNFDGAVKGRSQRGGVGALLRDSEGEFVASFAAPISTARPLFGEVYALLEGLRLAADSGVEYLWIEGDSKIAIEMLNGWREADEGEEKPVMEECRKLMRRFKGVTARHVFREANKSADHLANLGVEEAAHRQWRSRRSPPPSLLSFLWADIAGYLVPRLVL